MQPTGTREPPTTDLADLRSYVADTIRFCSDNLPNAFFGRPGGPSALIFADLPLPVRFIDLSVSTGKRLRLKHIEIYEKGAGEPRNIASEAELILSSQAPRTEELVKSRRFLVPHDGERGFSTRQEPTASARVILPAPRSLDRIVVSAGSQGAARAAMQLRVAVSADGESWTVLRDGVKPEATGELLAERRRQSPVEGRLGKVRSLADETVLRVLLGDFQSAAKGLRGQVGARSDERQEIRKVVTKELLLARNLEWGKHGIRRTFRFWTREEKAAYLEFSNRVVGILLELGFDACVGYGGVLSAIRDNDLMPHDDDLDVIVSAPRERFAFIGDFADAISELLTGRGLEVTGGGGTNGATLRKVSDGGKSIDVFVGFEEGAFVSWFPGPRHALRRETVFPASAFELHGVELLLPHDPSEYAATVYGPGWRVPTPGWNHRYDRGEYRDWFRPTAEGEQVALVSRPAPPVR